MNGLEKRFPVSKFLSLLIEESARSHGSNLFEATAAMNEMSVSYALWKCMACF